VVTARESSKQGVAREVVRDAAGEPAVGLTGEPSPEATGGLRIRVLGPLEVSRGGVRVEPTSPKLRALLIDLVIHRAESVSRDRIVDDLWGEHPPATATGIVQNYVSQLRRALGPESMRTSGRGYALADECVVTDVAEFEAHLERARTARDAGDVATVQEAATDALALWRGDPMADVAFEPFAQSEIRRLGELRAMVVELQLEAEIAAGRPGEAVALLEVAVTEYPLRERRWWLLMLALYRSGRQAEALRTYQRARIVLADELGLEPGTELRDLEQAILVQRPDLDRLVQPRPLRPRRGRPGRAALVGRAVEWSVIETFLDHRGDADGLLVLSGEPGIGKTKLLEEAHGHVEARGGVIVAGRAFEAEHGRPYGAWVDALRGVELPDLDPTTWAGLATLLPELSAEPVELDDPNRLYDAVVRLFDTLAGPGPVAVLLDDAHWLDEPSLALLHFAVRRLVDADVSFVAAARPAELAGNVAAARVVESLRRDEMLSELTLGPLPAASIGELTEPIAPDADAGRIAEATNGNPLFALEMARAMARGDDPLTSRVDALIGDRLGRLDEGASKLVPWIAAFGRGVPPAILARLVEPSDLFAPLGELERHGVVQADDLGSVDFVHDLVRDAAYRRLSTPRRSMLHGRIGVVLAATADPDDGLAADTARHADAGGDSRTCAWACLRAARRCLRLLGYSDAERFVTLGRTHSRRLPPVERVAVELELIRVLLHPGVRLRDPGELTRDLSDLCAEAQQLGLDAELSSGLSLLARAYHWGWGDIPRARALTQRAAQLLEGSPEPNAEPLLEAARCLAYLEMDMDRTARLFDDLGALHGLAAQSFQYQWGLGLVQAWRGDVEAARAALTQAIDLAAARGQHWVSFECTARLALLELEAGERDAPGPLCAQLTVLAGRFGEGSEQPYAQAISALDRIARGDLGGDAALEDAIGELQRIDARFLASDLLGIAAELQYRDGDLERAGAWARRALQLAGEVERPFEAARAHALLACIAATLGDLDECRQHLDATTEDGPGSLPGHMRGLQHEAERLAVTRRGDQGADTWR
jgi:DNA-binding SARP family transcriptional activator